VANPMGAEPALPCLLELPDMLDCWTARLLDC
jgi:hypothetical protein